MDRGAKCRRSRPSRAPPRSPATPGAKCASCPLASAAADASPPRSTAFAYARPRPRQRTSGERTHGARADIAIHHVARARARADVRAQAEPPGNGTLGVFLHRAMTLGASQSERASVCADGRLVPAAQANADGELYPFNDTVPGATYARRPPTSPQRARRDAHTGAPRRGDAVHARDSWALERTFNEAGDEAMWSIVMVNCAQASLSYTVRNGRLRLPRARYVVARAHLSLAWERQRQLWPGRPADVLVREPRADVRLGRRGGTASGAGRDRDHLRRTHRLLGVLAPMEAVRSAVRAPLRARTVRLALAPLTARPRRTRGARCTLRPGTPVCCGRTGSWRDSWSSRP